MYRLFEEKNGVPCTLFHGVNKSRKLPLDTWVDAEIKNVHDGSRDRATEYVSGFHVLPSFESVIKFLNRFKVLDNRVICAVDVDIDAGIWDKEHSLSDVKLVKRMKITSEYWDKRVKANEYSNLQ